MKRMTGILTVLVLIAGGVFYYTTFFTYQPSEELSQFPVPRNAELLEVNQHARIYSWIPASEENGIPVGYEVVLKFNGWEEGEREGASVIYTKEDKKIDLISQTQLLTFLDMN